MTYPNLAWIRRNLRYPAFGLPVVRRKVLAAYIVGSEARGTARPDSDIDIAIVVQPVRGKSSLRLSEHYHWQILDETRIPTWNGRQVDFQFFYETDAELSTYSKIPVSHRRAKN